jgi:hypothetical protein
MSPDHGRLITHEFPPMPSSLLGKRYAVTRWVIAPAHPFPVSQFSKLLDDVVPGRIGRPRIARIRSCRHRKDGSFRSSNPAGRRRKGLKENGAMGAESGASILRFEDKRRRGEFEQTTLPASW